MKSSPVLKGGMKKTTARPVPDHNTHVNTASSLKNVDELIVHQIRQIIKRVLSNSTSCLIPCIVMLLIHSLHPAKSLHLFRGKQAVVDDDGVFSCQDATTTVMAVQIDEVHARDSDNDKNRAIAKEIPCQASGIFGRFRGLVQQGADDVAERLPDEENRRGAFAFCIASGIRGRPRVNQGDWFLLARSSLISREHIPMPGKTEIR